MYKPMQIQRPHFGCGQALDLDVLVHGEAERNDMVEYFAENLVSATKTLRKEWEATEA